MNDPPSLEATFFAALEKSAPRERAAYLDEACAGDPDLRRRVEKMLTASAQAGSFLDQPAGNPVVTVDDQARTGGPGTPLVRPYKLREQLGEGGRGADFLAEQTQPVQRQVALKIIMALSATGDQPKALEAHHKGLCYAESLAEDSPRDASRLRLVAECRVWVANLTRELGQLREARDLYGQIADFYEANPTARRHGENLTPAWARIADIALKQCEAKAGADAVDRLFKVNATSAEALNSPAHFLMYCPESRLRDFPRAVELSKKAAQLAPNAAYIWSTLGNAR
jgi:tetratricopeptide (TPR) repeat protein